MSTQVEFSDRYQALGIPYPDPATMCHGPCEGVGCYPHFRPCEGQMDCAIWPADAATETVAEARAWQHEHAQAHTWRSVIRNLWRHREWWFWRSVLRDVVTGRYFRCDGWHFITCAECGGSGKARER